MKEIEREGILTERQKIKNEIQQNINDIGILNKNIKILEEEEKYKNSHNFTKKHSEKFYIPTLVKSFPELLYDKINKMNKNENSALKNDESFPSIIGDNKIEKINKNLYKSKSLINLKNNWINKLINNYNKKLKSNTKLIYKINRNKPQKNKENYFNTLRIEHKENNFILDFERANNTTRMYDQIINLSTEEKKENKINNLIKTFLLNKNNAYLDSINEKRSRSYYNLLKDVNSIKRNMKVDDIEKLYIRNYENIDNKIKNCFKEIKKINKNMKLNEKLLLRTLLIRK